MATFNRDQYAFLNVLFKAAYRSCSRFSPFYTEPSDDHIYRSARKTVMGAYFMECHAAGIEHEAAIKELVHRITVHSGRESIPQAVPSFSDRYRIALVALAQRTLNKLNYNSVFPKLRDTELTIRVSSINAQPVTAMWSDVRTEEVVKSYSVINIASDWYSKVFIPYKGVYELNGKRYFRISPTMYAGVRKNGIIRKRTKKKTKFSREQYALLRTLHSKSSHNALGKLLRQTYFIEKSAVGLDYDTAYHILYLWWKKRYERNRRNCTVEDKPSTVKQRWEHQIRRIINGLFKDNPLYSVFDRPLKCYVLLSGSAPYVMNMHTYSDLFLVGLGIPDNWYSTIYRKNLHIDADTKLIRVASNSVLVVKNGRVYVQTEKT